MWDWAEMADVTSKRGMARRGIEWPLAEGLIFPKLSIPASLDKRSCALVPATILSLTFADMALGAESLLDWSTRPATNLETAATDAANVDGIIVTTSGTEVGGRTSDTLRIAPTTTNNGYSGIIESAVNATIDDESVYQEIRFDFSEPVYNLRYRVIDVDGITGGSNFSDLIIFNSSGGVPSAGTSVGANITYTPVTGRAIENALSNCTGDQAQCQINVVFDGPITFATTRHVAADVPGTTNPTNQAIQIFDLTFNTPPNASNNANSTVFNTTTSGNVITDNDGSGLDDDAQDNASVLVNRVTHPDGSVTVGGTTATLTLANGAFLTINQDGSYTFDPNGAYDALVAPSTTETFTYRIEDQEGLFDAGSEATLTITIFGPNSYDFDITKTADRSSVSTAGETITYTITVENTAAGDLISPSLSDVISQNGTTLSLTTGPTLSSGDTDGDSNLDAGETWTYTATYDVTTPVLNDGNDILNTATFTTTEIGSKLSSVPVSTPGAPIPCAGDTWPGNAISGISGTTICNNVGATSQSGEPTTYGGGSVNSIWYQWTAPADGTVTFDTCDVTNTQFDTTLQGFTGGAVNALTQVATNDDSGTCTNFQSLISFPVTLGTVYTIQVDGYASNTGQFELNWNMVPLDADLSLTKTVDDAAPASGTDVTYTLTLTNSGPGAAPSVQVVDLLPPGYTHVSSTPSQGSAAHASGVVTWTVGNVLNGAAPTLDIVATTSGTATERNTAQVIASGVNDPDSTPGDSTGDDYAFVDVTPVAQADLSLTKVVDNSAPNFGTDVTFTITVTNGGPLDATNVEITDLLPAGLAFVSATPSQGSYDDGTGIWDVGTINNATSASLDIVATVNGAGPIINAAEVTTSDLNDPDSTPGDGSGDDHGTATVTAATPPVTGSPRCTGTNLVTNSGFETPFYGSAAPTFHLENPALVPGWITTDTAIEIWENGFGGFAAHTGLQYAELNANIAGTLTNSGISVNPRAELTVYWAHQGRGGTDTASLNITDDGGGSTTPPNFSTGNTAWGEYSATHVVSDTGTSASLAFTAISTGSGSLSVGNFLDTIEVCQTYITITKAFSSKTDADTSGSDTVGDTITYQFTVSNPAGNESGLSTVQIVDDKIGTFNATPVSGDDGDNVLEPGETWVVNQDYTLVQADLDAASPQEVNIAYAQGDTGSNTIRSDDATETVALVGAAALTVTKTATFGAGPTTADGTTDNLTVGEVVTYTYEITNTGNQTITAISLGDVHNGSGTAPAPDADTATLTDNGPAGDSTNPSTGDSAWDTLAPGDVLTVTATYTVTQSDVDTLQ